MKLQENHSPVRLTDEDLEILKASHAALFSEVLKIGRSCLHSVFNNTSSSSSSSSERDYLVVPLCYIPFLDPVVAYIDFDSARLLASLQQQKPASSPSSSSDNPLPGKATAAAAAAAASTPIPCHAHHLTPVCWPEDRERLGDAIVARRYNPSPLYMVQSISDEVTISSHPGIQGFGSYREYFEGKYGCPVANHTQPALRCKALGESGARLQLLRSRYKTERGEDVKKSEKRGRRHIDLFPEVCSLYRLPYTLWRLAYCVPSVLWRVECLLTVDLLRNIVSAETGVGRLSEKGEGEGSSEFTTHLDLRGYKDVGFGSLPSRRLLPATNAIGGWVSEILPTEFSSSLDPLTPPLRGPDNTLLLQALTPRSASDCLDLERLETLGDSFLKLSSTVFLYLDRTDAHEGRLSKARARRVCNQNLYQLARRRGIVDSIFSATFDPKSMWLPPCFRFDQSQKEGGGGGDHESSLLVEERCYRYHKLRPKGVADCVESLTGAYLVSGGILAGLKFMTWMGIKICPASPLACRLEVDRAGDALAASMESLSTEEEGPSSLGSSRGGGGGGAWPGHSDLEEGEIASSLSSTDSYAQAPRPKRKRPLGDNDSSVAGVWQPPIFVRDSSHILSQFFGLARHRTPRALDREQTSRLDCLLSRSLNKRPDDSSGGSSGSDRILGHTFRDRTLLLQAITHASYSRNRLTECYQRLEFLGDAVIDYLVTCHIYSTFPHYGPGEITAMRSALVNNQTFAEFAEGLGLHKVLLYDSPSLYRQIELYVKSGGGGGGGGEGERGDRSSPESEEVRTVYIVWPKIREGDIKFWVSA